jgi:hypothetical protein
MLGSECTRAHLGDHRVLDFGFHRVRPAVVARLALERAMRFPDVVLETGL